MTVSGDKIKELISHYGEQKGYLPKSYIKRFCEDFQLNYIQWSAHCNGSQKPGLKIIQILIDIFPNVNLNWLLKDDENMLVDNILIAAEPIEKYSNGITNEMLMKKLESIEKDIKALALKP